MKQARDFRAILDRAVKRGMRRKQPFVSPRLRIDEEGLSQRTYCTVPRSMSQTTLVSLCFGQATGDTRILAENGRAFSPSTGAAGGLTSFNHDWR